MKHFLENHATFNSGEIKIVKLPKDYVNLADLQPPIEELKQDRKTIRDDKKNRLENLVELIRGLRPKEFEIFTTKPDDLLVSDEIKWNFTKFLVDRDRNVVKRYSPTCEPEKIEKDIESLLK